MVATPLTIVGTPVKPMYHDVYTGSVVANNDPTGKGRVTLKIPQILGTATSNWAVPTGASNGVPALGSIVYVQFIGGDVNHPSFTIAGQFPYFIAPTGDITGKADLANIKYGLANNTQVVLLPGKFFINAPIEIPTYVSFVGSGRGGVDQYRMTIIQAVGAIAAVICSAGWLEGSNTSTVPSVYISKMKITGNNTASHCVVLQNYSSLIEDVYVSDTAGDGIRFDGVSQNGLVNVSGSGVNNQIIKCLAQNCGRGFTTNDPNHIFTDGLITNSFVVSSTGAASIHIDYGAGWTISQNHMYGIPQDCIWVGQLFMTRIVNNYIETWGTTTTAGTYRAINGNTGGNSDEGSGSVIMGNTANQVNAPGNVGSSLEGISFRGDASNTSSVTIVGNLMRCEPASATFVHAYGIAIYTTTTGIVNVVSTGNNMQSNWTSTFFQSAGGGTINLSTGV